MRSSFLCKTAPALIMLALLFQMLADTSTAGVNNIVIDGDYRDVDGDGNRDFYGVVYVIRPTGEINYSNNEQYAKNAPVYLDGELAGFTNETGVIILYNITGGEKEVRVEYLWGGQEFYDVWQIEDPYDDAKDRVGYFGYIIGVVVAVFLSGLFLIWLLDKFVRRSNKNKKKAKTWTECRECGARVKTANLDVHMFKVHKKR